MVVQPVEVLLGPGFQFAHGVINLLEDQTVHLRAVDSVADAYCYSFHRLSQMLLIFF